MTFTYGLSAELLTPGQSQDWNEGSTQTGLGTEGRALLLWQAAWPAPDVSTQAGTVPDVSIPEARLQSWAHFLHLSMGPGPSQMLKVHIDVCPDRKALPSWLSTQDHGCGPEWVLLPDVCTESWEGLGEGWASH